MSGNEVTENACLLCYQIYKTNGKECKRDTQKYKDQIFVVFLMRKVLEIPKAFCEKLLTTKGNPSQWIFCCPFCSETIHNLHKVFLELTIIQKKYDLLRQKVKLILEYSKSETDASWDEIILENQFQSAKEIRSFIFSGGKNDSIYHRQEVTYDSDQIKLDLDALWDIKDEAGNIDQEEIFPDFKDESFDNYSVDDETDAKVYKKEDIVKTKGKIRELRERKRKKLVDEDCSSSEESNKNSGDSDSDWGSGNDNYSVDSENSEDEVDLEAESSDKQIQVSSPKKTRKARSKNTGTSINSSDNSDNTRYSCVECNESFRWVYELTSHNVDKHGKKLTCGECVAMFENPKEGKEHYENVHPGVTPKLRMHKNTTGMNCSYCGAFVKPGGINKHLQEFHKIPKCDLCGKIFGTRAKLKIHRQGKHFKELNLEPFQCKICKRNFSSAQFLKTHMTVKHTRDFRFFCPTCNAGATSQKDLDTHIKKIHTGERDFSCQFCPSAFYTKWEMEKHEIVAHTKEYKFTCEICSKGFVFKNKLDQHNLVVHPKGPKPFVCELCNHAFNSKTMMKFHQRAHHYKEMNLEPFQCSECGKIVMTPTALRRHMIRDHTKAYKYSCSECGKQLMTQGDLDKHVRIQHKKEHQYLCTICGKPYFTQSSLKAHIQRYHTKEFTHKCKLCPDKGYSSSWGLSRHIKVAHPELIQDTSTN